MPRRLRQSRLSANDKGDNEVKPGAGHKSPGIYLTAEENPGKPQLRDHLMRALRPVIASNGIPYLQMTSVGSHSTPGREREEKKESLGTGRESDSFSYETSCNVYLLLLRQEDKSGQMTLNNLIHY